MCSKQEILTELNKRGYTQVAMGRGEEQAWFIFWRKGLLVFFDTCRRSDICINSCEVYFNLMGLRQVEINTSISTRWHGDIAACSLSLIPGLGDADFASGLALLDALQEEDKVLTVWFKRPHLWLVSHEEELPHSTRWGESNSTYYKKIVQDKINILPKHIRNNIQLCCE